MNSLRQLRSASTISQMRREFGITARALRYYEEQGLLSPERSQRVRLYSHRDRVRLKLVLCGRSAGFSLRVIRELFEIYDRQGRAAQQAKAVPRMQAQLAALEAQRRQLDAAIEKLRTASARLFRAAGLADKDRDGTRDE